MNSLQKLQESIEATLDRVEAADYERQKRESALLDWFRQLSPELQQEAITRVWLLTKQEAIA